MERQPLRSTRAFNYSYSVDEFGENELNVAKILVQLPIPRETQRFPLLSWGCKRRRSAINVTPSSSPVHPGNGATRPFVKKMEIQSPQTPLSFSPSESDCRSKHSKRKPFKKKAYDKLKGIEVQLSTQNAELKTAMRDVLQYHRDLQAKNKALHHLKTHMELKYPNATRVLYTQEKREQETPMTMTNQTSMSPIAEADKSVEISQHPCSTCMVSGGVDGSLERRLNPLPDLNFGAADQVFDMGFNHAVLSALARKKRYEINKEKRYVKRRF